MHASSIAAAVDVPVSADLENGFADHPEAVFDTVTDPVAVGVGRLLDRGLHGQPGPPDLRTRSRRRAGGRRCAGCARRLRIGADHAGGKLHPWHPDLTDTIARLQAYQEAGADVLYAPGLSDIDDIRRVVSSVDCPVNVLVCPGLASVAELADVGVGRISVGGWFNKVALAALARAARELLDAGTNGFTALAAEGRGQSTTAFRDG